jgi:NAD(P)-dependent dehydrogenase (short-subunit alcohol dehydrogenase family)
MAGLCRGARAGPSVGAMDTIALITGANKGIGFETARQLAARGVTVLVGARDEARGIAAERALRDGLRGGLGGDLRELGGPGGPRGLRGPRGLGGDADARFVPLDVTDAASVREAADWIEKEFGRLDILVNNAGIAVGGGPPSETDLEAMREVYETNVLGVIMVTNAMLPLLRRAPAARIVNVSSEVGSIAAMTDPGSPLAQMPAGLAYPSSKTALNMITALYAKELRDTPIKVNAANPGYTATDLNGNSGFRSAAEAAEVSVHLATLDASGPSGTLWGYLWSPQGAYGALPW